jgi:thiol-disulfide isomerase/thioredoxin
MKQSIIIPIVIILALGVGIFFIVKESQKPGTNDGLAQHLTDQGVKFYGAFWCPHCQAQKKLFGTKSAKILPYVECSTPNGGAQVPMCTDAEVEGYPTWEFPNKLNITSENEPTVCTTLPGNETEDAVCKQPGVASSFRTTWIFSNGIKVLSKENPIIKDGVWTFNENSRLSGEVSLETLAEQSGYNAN